MVAAFQQRRDYVVQRLRAIPGIKLAEPQVWVGVGLVGWQVVACAVHHVPQRPCAFRESCPACLSPTNTHPKQGAFYVLPDVSAFFGPGVEAAGFGPVPDVDALAMYLIKVRGCCWF
jgi:hypothetical protein